jgi:hypothetical protein
VTAAVLRNELHDYIDTLPERSLYALRPLLSVLAEPLYTVTTSLTAEEISMIDEGMQEYRDHPESFVPLESIK